MFIRGLTVVNSCSTYNQLKVAHKYIGLMLSKRYIEYDAYSLIYQEYGKRWKVIGSRVPEPPKGPPNRDVRGVRPFCP